MAAARDPLAIPVPLPHHGLMHRASSIPLLAVLALALAACDGGTGPGGPRGGDYDAVLQSPNGPEAAAHLQLDGVGIENVAADSAFVASSDVSGGRRVVLVRPQAGTLRFRVTMAEGQGPPAVRVLEVAAPDDQPRASVAGYRVAFTRVEGP